MDKNSVEARLTIQPGIQGTGSWDGNTLNFQPLSAWPQGETVKVGLEAGARSIVFLPILTSQDWTFIVDNPNLVFLSGAGVVPNVQIYDFDNGEINALTQSENGVLDYSLSWDRSKVVYCQQVDGKATEIRSKDIISGEDTLLFSCPQEHSCRNAVLSPEEDFLAFV